MILDNRAVLKHIHALVNKMINGISKQNLKENNLLYYHRCQ